MEDEIIVGTNEEFVLGFYVIPNKDETFNLTSSFTNHSHLGRVKNLAVKGKYLASGSTDEDIRIFNLETRLEVGCLSNHQGSVTCLEFHESGFLFSGSDDGKISIFEMGTWKLVGELSGHKSAIIDVAIHPSGKLALSISKNKQMFLWDLRKGKKAFVNVLPKPGDLIQWSPDGSEYVLVSSNSLFMYDASTGYVRNTFDFKNGIHCFCYLTDHLVAVGGECKDVAIFDTTSMEEVVRWDAHEHRTKALVKMETEDDSCSSFFSASSDGYIKLWFLDLELIKSRNPVKLIGEINSKCRITCMTFTSKESRVAYEEMRENVKKQHVRGQKKGRKTREKSRKRSHEDDDAQESKEAQAQKKFENKPKTKLSPSTLLQQLEEHDSTELKGILKKKDSVSTCAQTNKNSGVTTGKKRKLKSGKMSNKMRKVDQTNSPKKQKVLQESAEEPNSTGILCKDVSSSSKGIKKFKKKKSKISATSVQENNASTTPSCKKRNLKMGKINKKKKLKETPSPKQISLQKSVEAPNNSKVMTLKKNSKTVAKKSVKNK